MPPPISKTKFLRDDPIGTSTRPIFLNQLGPFRRIGGILAQVSTLLRIVGCSQRPFSTLLIYLALGSPTFPCIEAIRALDSPHTKAPPPLTISRSKLRLLPKIFFPK